MRYVLVGTGAETDQLKACLKNRNTDCEVYCFNRPGFQDGEIYYGLRRLNPELLITVNLAGFELTTLCDGILYNLLDCKSLHLLTERNLNNEKLLTKQLSISMFFFCWGESFYEYLSAAYPNIPFLRSVEQLLPKAGNFSSPDILSEIFRLLQQETGLTLI